MADVDYTAVVRGLRTSDLIAIMVSPDAARALVDPSGVLDARIVGDDIRDARDAEAEFLARAKTAVLAAAAELDRRIPIPEST